MRPFIYLETIFILALFGLLVVSGCKERQKYLDRYLDAAHRLWGFEGSVVVAWGGNVVLSKGYGMANQKIGIPNGPDTKFFIGSITKQFTAAAILALQEDGLLDVHDPISKYLPDYPQPVGDKMTIHHLLTHTSGIPDYVGDIEIFLKRMHSITPANLIDSFKDKPLEFEPGRKFQYSNSGYILLGAITEQVSGQSYEAYLHHRILQPNKMFNTGYARREAGLPDRADGHTVEGEDIIVDALPVHFSVLHTAGALYSTVKDLNQWDRALYKDDVLSKSSLIAMFTPYGGNYGYGWFIESRYGRRHMYHSGFLDGFHSIISRWPNDKLCIIVLSNEDEAPVGKIARGLAAVMFDQPYIAPIRKTPAPIDPGQFEEYAGAYRIDHEIFRIVSLERNTLFTHIQGQRRHMLHPQAADTFFFAADNTKILTFMRDDRGMVTGLETEDEGIHIRGTKLPDSIAAEIIIDRTPVRLRPEILDRYAGIYEIERSHGNRNSWPYIYVIPAGDRLIVSITDSEAIELFPGSKTEFFHKDADFRLTFILDRDKHVVGCIVKMGDQKLHGKKKY